MEHEILGLRLKPQESLKYTNYFISTLLNHIYSNLKGSGLEVSLSKPLLYYILIGQKSDICLPMGRI